MLYTIKNHRVVILKEGFVMKRLAFLLAAALLLAVVPVVGFSLETDNHTVLLFLLDERHVDADGVCCNTVKDLSGLGNHGTIEGEINVVPGKMDNGYEFDGNSFIQVPKSRALDITQHITVEAWAKPEQLAGENFILDKRAGNPRLGYELFQVDNVFGFMMATPGKKAVLNQDEPAPIGTWQYHAATYDGNKLIYYLDGQFLKETEQSGDLGVESDLFIGAENGTKGFYVGVLDNLRISNIVRTADEIAQAFNQATAVNPQYKLAQTWGLIKTQ
jgi:hypothetical protein